MTHPAVQPHLDASSALQDAANKHREAAEAHEDGDHEQGKEHAKAARQSALEAAIKSESAAQLSANPHNQPRPQKDAPDNEEE